MPVIREVLRPGDDTTLRPSRGQRITVHCTGVLPNGKQFWCTRDATEKPFSFSVGIGKVIKGWDEGMMQMCLGEVARLTLTSEVAYAAKGFPAWGIPPNSPLVFEIEMLRIE